MRCFLFKKVLIREKLPINQLITSKNAWIYYFAKKLWHSVKSNCKYVNRFLEIFLKWEGIFLFSFHTALHWLIEDRHKFTVVVAVMTFQLFSNMGGIYKYLCTHMSAEPIIGKPADEIIVSSKYYLVVGSKIYIHCVWFCWQWIIVEDNHRNKIAF